MGGQGQRRILVVDDDFYISDLLMQHLTEQGYAVDVAINARAMGRHLELHPPDLILLDIMLPGMDGSEIGHLLKASVPTAGSPSRSTWPRWARRSSRSWSVKRET